MEPQRQAHLDHRPALTEEGERVARGLPDKLAGVEFDQVLTSPRLRARRPPSWPGYGDAEVEEDLVEWAYGDYEGITTPEIRETVPGWSIWTHPAPGGESADEVAERLDRVVVRARTVSRTLVFSHGHALRVLAARWLGQPVELGRFLHLDTATTSVLGLDRGSPVVIRWNA